MRPLSLHILAPSLTCGGIHDLGLGESWNSTRLHHEVSHRTAALSALDIGRGSVVAIGHGGTARFFADLLATWQLGATAACLDPSLTPGELRNVIEFSKAVVLLIDGPAPVDLLSVPIVELARNDSKRQLDSLPDPDPDDPALLLFTSGTTGTPKAVILSFRAIRARIEANHAAIGKSALVRTLVSLPTHFGHGLIGNALTPLLAGGDIVLHPLGIQMATDLGRIVDEHGITFMSSVPTLWRMALMRSPPPTRGSLIRVHVGSAPFPAELWSQVVAWSGAEVVNCYGTTETANWIAGASSRSDGIADGLIGRLWGGSAAVLDASGQLHQTGSGELLIRSPSLMSGYLKRPDLTAAALHEGWYRTGDRGAIDEDRRLRLTGRIKDEINRAGFKVQPAEMDALLERHPAVAEACVFGISDPLGGEAIAAAIRTKNGASLDTKGLQAWCLQRVRREAVPEHCFFVEEIPRTARGKISRDVVRRLLVEERAAGSPVQHNKLTASYDHASRTASSIAAAVEFAWTEVFGQDSYRADLSLSETGGDSLDMMRLLLSIERRLDTRLSWDVLEPPPRPGELVAALEQQLGAAASLDLPVVFLLLPAEGDSPALARLRASLKDRARFVSIDYPDWREMIDAGSRFEVLVKSTVEQIRRQTRDNAVCHLVGYSFGGFVAIEAARHLDQHGRRIGLIGLIDTRTERPNEIEQPGRVPFVFRSLGKIISALILMSAFRPLKLLCRLATLLPARPAFTIAFMLTARLRTKALRRVHLDPLPAPVTLYRSLEGPLPDNGWTAYLSRLTIVPIGGDHHSILESPYLEVLSESLAVALEPYRVCSAARSLPE